MREIKETNRIEIKRCLSEGKKIQDKEKIKDTL